MFGFILGALAGSLAAWWWRNDIQHYMEKKLPNVRAKAADQLSSLEQKAEDALSRARHQIDRIRPEDQGSRTRSSGSHTQSTGV
jgi:hypothetical protein